MKITHLLSATALMTVGTMSPGVGWAADKPLADPAKPVAEAAANPQSASQSEAAASDDQKPDDSIVITGSRIRTPNLASNVPITSIAGDSLLKEGQANVGDALNNLPGLRSTFAQQNPGSGIGIAGLSLLDLRGLGTQRTLVLVNGRRHVAADILNNAVSPDVTSIPNDLIDRVDIVTGGNSAVYGSDAIAGVVNFVLKRDYDGFQLRGLAGISEKGFGGNQYISGMFGKNFAGGRGNVTLQGEYSRQDRVFASDVPWFRTQDGLFTVDTDSAGLPSASDGFPDTVFLHDVRSVTINPYGLIPVPQPTGAGALCGVGTAANNGGPNSNGTPYNCTYLFTQDGHLIPQTGARFGSGPTGSIIGGNGQTGREGNTLSVLPFLERYNINMLAHYEFDKALEFFLEAKWTRTNALGNNSGPSFIQGQITQFDFRERPRLDNPYLNAADRTTLTNAILTAGFEPRLVTRTPLTAADLTAIANGSLRFDLARNLLDVGLRDENFRRDTVRVVAGFRGTFNDNWTYEVSANYGRFDQRTITDGFIDRQRFVLAMDAGRNPVTGQIQCRSQYDPASALPIQRTDAVSLAIASQNAARLAADIAACKPYNPFGGSDNSAAIAYFSHQFRAKASLEQLDFQGFVSGDSSKLFELPGGPIRFSLGGEYRRERAYYKQDDFVANGFSNGVAIPTFDPPDFEVKEAFAELQVPLLKDVPFFKELSLTGAARISDYGGGAGSVWTYNGGVQWAPISDIRFRGNYARAVRAPNVSETGFPLVPNFANAFVDPCRPDSIGQNATRQTNCQAALGANAANLTNVNYSLGIVSGSNTNLKAEKSDSWTLGTVIQPHWVRGLSLSIDYYDITVNGVIATVAAQTIANNCYDMPQPNIFCGQFRRNTGTTPGPNGELPGAILFNSLIQAPLNFAKRVRRGVDIQFGYRTNITNNIKINSNVIYTHVIKSSDYQDPTNPKFENRILGEVGDPADEFVWDTDLSLGQVTLGYRLHFIGRQYITAWENFNSLNGSPPLNLDASSPVKYPAVTYSDLRLEWNLPSGSRKDAFQFYFGANNIFNQLPPLGTTATGAGTAIFDYRGRNFYAGFRIRY